LRSGMVHFYLSMVDGNRRNSVTDRLGWEQHRGN
jgi:hypothetical protein